MRIRSGIVAIAVIALVAAAGCGRGGSGGGEGAAPSSPGVPGATRGSIVYSVSRESFFDKPLAGGEAKLQAVADGELDASLFAAWADGELVFEAFTDGRRDLFALVPGKKDQRLLAKGVGSVLGLRGSAVAYFTETDDDRFALLEQPVAGGEARELLTAERLTRPSDATAGPLPFVRGEGRASELGVLDPSSDTPVSVAKLDGGRTFGTARVTSDGIAYVVNPPVGGFGDVMYWDRSSGSATKVAEEADLLDAAPDGGLLVRQNLRGGVSGVNRTRVVYVPAGKAASARSRQDLETYVSALHAVAFVGDNRALMSSRTEGNNALTLFDLDTFEATVLQQDSDLQFSELLPLSARGALAVRVEPGASAPDGGDSGGETVPEIVTLAEELMWVPFDGSEATVLAETSSGPMHLIQALP